MANEARDMQTTLARTEARCVRLETLLAVVLKTAKIEDYLRESITRALKDGEYSPYRTIGPTQ